VWGQAYPPPDSRILDDGDPLLALPGGSSIRITHGTAIDQYGVPVVIPQGVWGQRTVGTLLDDGIWYPLGVASSIDYHGEALIAQQGDWGQALFTILLDDGTWTPTVVQSASGLPQTIQLQGIPSSAKVGTPIVSATVSSNMLLLLVT